MNSSSSNLISFLVAPNGIIRDVRPRVPGPWNNWTVPPLVLTGAVAQPSPSKDTKA